MRKLLTVLALGALFATPALAGECGARKNDAEVAEVSRQNGWAEPLKIEGEEFQRYRDGLRELAGREMLEEETAYLWVVATEHGFVIVVEMDAGGCVVAAFRVPDGAHHMLRLTPTS
jgi:hypothetical protein